MARKIAILGSTGSIGQQALEVIRCFPEDFKVVGLAAGGNWRLLVEQIKEFHPRVVAIAREDDLPKIGEALYSDFKPEIYYGEEGLVAVATCPEAALVLTAVSGTAGLVPTLAAIKKGKDIALANKETLVMAGSLVTEAARQQGARILPVDSEHSAIWQCLSSSSRQEVAKLILTASGGPFRQKPADLSEVTVEMALAHPNWKMGRKITIDSATLMNKGLEVIEARWLFEVNYNQIQVVVHPQSIIHSMVEFVDGSILAQLGIPDMRIPIQYALSYPSRWPNQLPRVDWAIVRELTFEPPDTRRFRCLKLALEAARAGGTMPAVLNAANEVAVEAFLSRRIGFTQIPEIVEKVLAAHQVVHTPLLEEILAADLWAREEARQVLKER